MKAIISRTISGATDKVLRLSQEGGMRPIQAGSDWTKLVVGVRWSMGSDVAVPTGFRIHFGLAAAGGGIFSSTGHALFARSAAATAWASQSDGTCWHEYIGSWSQRGFGDLIKRINTTETTLVSEIMRFHDGWTPNRMPRPVLGVATACFLVFTKGATWTVDAIFNEESSSTTTWQTRSTCTQAKFIEAGEALSVANALTFLGAGFTSRTYASLAVSEATNGNLTQVVVGATHSGQYLDLSDIIVAKWA